MLHNSVHFGGFTLRWQVHGRDAVSGKRVTLEVDGPEAMLAVQAAHAKRIVVSRVTRGLGRIEGGGGKGGGWVGNVLLPMACAGVVVLGAVCGVLAWRERGEREMVRDKIADNAALAMQVSRAQGTVQQMQANQPGAQLLGELDAARDRIALLENVIKAPAQDAGMKREWMAALAAAEERTKIAEDRAASANNEAGAAREKIAEIAQSNRTLTTQMDLLKSQLLVAVAKPVGNAAAAARADPSPDEDAAIAAKPLRWALRTPYETAANFVATHFEKETMRSAPLDNAAGEIAWTASAAANAATVRITHDAKKEKVYAAVLTVSFAADGPAEKLDENLRLVREFLAAFAPAMNDVSEKTANITDQLRGQDATERRVLIRGDTKITVWNNAMGLFTWRAESAWRLNDE